MDPQLWRGFPYLSSRYIEAMRTHHTYALALLALVLVGCAPQSEPTEPGTPDTYCQSLTHEQCTIELTDKVLIALDTYGDTTKPTPGQVSAYDRMDAFSSKWSGKCMDNSGLVAGNSECAGVARELTSLIQVIDPSLVPVFRQ